MLDITWTPGDQPGTQVATVKMADIDAHAELSVGTEDLVGYSLLVFDDRDDADSMPVFEHHCSDFTDVDRAKVAATAAVIIWHNAHAEQ